MPASPSVGSLRSSNRGRRAWRDPDANAIDCATLEIDRSDVELDFLILPALSIVAVVIGDVPSVSLVENKPFAVVQGQTSLR
jgi:hypothetical protein